MIFVRLKSCAWDDEMKVYEKHNQEIYLVAHSGGVETLADVPAKVRDYLHEVLKVANERGPDIVSVMIFGSVAKGGFSPVSDVDLLVVLADEVPWKEKKRLEHDLAALELEHKLRERPKSKRELILTVVDRVAGQFKSQFVCYKREFISGNSAAVFGINPVLESLLLTTRIAFANDVMSARTAWGEELLSQVRVPLLTKGHLVKNCVGLLAFNAAALAVFPVVPNATKYSMSALKWMLHTCHFCITLKPSTIEQEIEFFRARLEMDATLPALLSLRRDYQPSFRFVIGCFGTIVRHYAVTVQEKAFPISVKPRVASAAWADITEERVSTGVREHETE